MLTLDTADRLRPCDTVVIAGQPLLIDDIADASTLAHPARLALRVVGVHGRTFHDDDVRIVYLNAGETVTFKRVNAHVADVTGQRPGRVI